MPSLRSTSLRGGQRRIGCEHLLDLRPVAHGQEARLQGGLQRHALHHGLMAQEELAPLDDRPQVLLREAGGLCAAEEQEVAHDVPAATRLGVDRRR